HHTSSYSCLHTTAPPAIYTLSLHDALPIFPGILCSSAKRMSLTSQNSRKCTAQKVTKSNCPWIFRLPTSTNFLRRSFAGCWTRSDRKSTRLNSSHLVISYAVFCLKKKIKLL